MTGDTTYRIIGESHSAPSTIVSSERAFVHAVVVFMNDADVALLKTYVSGWGAVALMLGDNGGRSVTMSHARVDSLLFLDEEYSLPRHSDGSRCGLLSISSDMRWFRST